MSVKTCCDFCDKPLRIDVVDGLYFTKFARSKNPIIRKSYRILCEDCAEKLDQVVDLARETWLKEIDISYRNQAVNRARRELLGTDG